MVFGFVVWLAPRARFGMYFAPRLELHHKLVHHLVVSWLGGLFLSRIVRPFFCGYGRLIELLHRNSARTFIEWKVNCACRGFCIMHSNRLEKELSPAPLRRSR